MSEKYHTLTAGSMSNGEKLFVVRTRSKQHKTIKASARLHRVSQKVYSSWERDEIKFPLKSGERIPVGTMTIQEKCRVMRFRSGMTLSQVAKKMGRCRLWIHRMEVGTAPVEELQMFWKVR